MAANKFDCQRSCRTSSNLLEAHCANLNFWRNLKIKMRRQLVYLWSYSEKMNQRFENAINTCRLHGQYSWSIRIGLLTLSIIMSKKCILVAVPLAAEAGHVLILTPLVVLTNVQFFTVTPSTGSSLVYLPRLLMLIPCLGPHVTLVTSITLLSSPREMHHLQLQFWTLWLWSYLIDRCVFHQCWDCFLVQLYLYYGTWGCCSRGRWYGSSCYQVMLFP